MLESCISNNFFIQLAIYDFIDLPMFNLLYKFIYINCLGKAKAYDTIVPEKSVYLFATNKRWVMNLFLNFILKIRNFLFVAFAVLWLQNDQVFGQSFAAPVSNPFLFKPAEVRQTPCLADLDADGDFDMLTGSSSGKFHYYQNSGLQRQVKFSDPQLNPFGLKTAGPFSRPVFADMDQDGDFDLVVGSERGDLEYYQNIGTATVPKFANLVNNPFLLNPDRKYLTPVFADLDGDSDLDLIAGTETNGIVYQENIGSPSVPKFGDLVSEPFFIVSSETDLVPAIGDMDNDGDLDLIVANQSPSFEYFENYGTKSMPAFRPPVINPFLIQPNTGDPAPFLIDLDRDGDIDMMTGQTAKCNYYENYKIVIENNQLDNSSPFSIFPNPAAHEINMSGFDSSHDSLIGIYDLNQNSMQVNFE